MFILFENLQKSIKRDVFDANGHRKHDFHDKTMANDTGENLQKSIKSDVSDANGHRKHDFHEKNHRD